MSRASAMVLFSWLLASALVSTALAPRARSLDSWSEPSETDRRYYRAWGLDAEAPEAHYRYATVMIHGRAWRHARAHLETTLRVDPAHVEARGAMAEVLVELGRVDEAEAHLRWLVENAGEAASWAHSFLGRIEASRGNRDEARRHFARASQLAPDKAWPQYNLGVSLLRNESPEDAATALARAVELDPGFARARRTLARILSRLGRHEEAIPHYLFLLEGAADDAILLRDLADAEAATSRTQPAREHYQRALQIARSRALYRPMVGEIEARLAALPPSPGDEPEAEAR